MRDLKRITVLVLVILFFYIPSVGAQVKPGTYSVTPYIGGHVFDGDQRLDSSPAYGLRLGYDFTRYLGLEASGDFTRTKYDRALP
ncbi:MAG: porin family protein, partial [Syntrophales bacterium]|nr:porin family protein [Syntrophales bacterium]